MKRDQEEGEKIIQRKKRRKLFPLFFVLFFFLLGVGIVLAVTFLDADLYRVDEGTIYIVGKSTNIYGNNRYGVTNTGEHDLSYFVPNKTQAEFDSFKINALSDNLTDISMCETRDGGWSAFGSWYDTSGWSTCSTSCSQSKTQRRDRTCTNPSPFCGGATCAGLSYETRTVTQDCSDGSCKLCPWWPHTIYGSTHWHCVCYGQEKSCTNYGGTLYDVPDRCKKAVGNECNGYACVFKNP